MNIYLPHIFPPDISIGWATKQEVRFIFQNVWTKETIFIYETITLETFINTVFNWFKPQSNKSASKHFACYGVEKRFQLVNWFEWDLGRKFVTFGYFRIPFLFETLHHALFKRGEESFFHYQLCHLSKRPGTQMILDNHFILPTQLLSLFVFAIRLFLSIIKLVSGILYWATYRV